MTPASHKRNKTAHTPHAFDCNNAGYGPDLVIKPGQIGEIVISSLISDASKTGYTATVYGGGVLSLRLTPEGQAPTRCASSAESLSEDRITAIFRALETWPEHAPCSLRRHAAAMGVPLAELKKACFANPGRAQPPLRDAYERARSQWKNAYNAHRDGRRG